MCPIVIDSRVRSTPIVVLVLTVTWYKVNTCGGDVDVRDTDVEDDLPRNFCDRMNNHLREGFSHREGRLEKPKRLTSGLSQRP